MIRSIKFDEFNKTIGLNIGDKITDIWPYLSIIILRKITNESFGIEITDSEKAAYLPNLPDTVGVVDIVIDESTYNRYMNIPDENAYLDFLERKLQDSVKTVRDIDIYMWLKLNINYIEAVSCNITIEQFKLFREYKRLWGEDNIKSIIAQKSLEQIGILLNKSKELENKAMGYNNV